MNKCLLYIPRPGASSQAVQRGYVDTMECLGWKVYVGDPKTKLTCGEWIKKYGIKLIMTHSRYGIRQLPIDIINDNDVVVFVNALPMNPANAVVGGPYEFAHADEPDLIKEIEKFIVHTNFEPHTWQTYMCGWKNCGIDIVHVPSAGNIVNALPPRSSILTDVAMVANFNHRQGVMRNLIEPLFKRLDLLGYSYQAFGDNVWHLAGLNYAGPLSGDTARLSHVYATAKVCPNVHTEQQVSSQICLNDRSFMIPLCGGVQVSDNPIAKQYLDQYCDIAISTTDFMNKVFSVVEGESRNFEKIRGGIEHVAHRHTYFNRLANLFDIAGMSDWGHEAKTTGSSVAVRHCWEMDARLSADERGIPYETKVIETT